MPGQPAAEPSPPSRFVDVSAHALRAAQCAACSHVTFPPRFFCPVCGAAGPFRDVLLHKGHVASLTECYVAPAGFAAPYIAGWVSFPEGPEVFGVLRSGEDVPLRSGTPVHVVAVPRDDGVGWEFRSDDGEVG